MTSEQKKGIGIATSETPAKLPIGRGACPSRVQSQHLVKFPINVEIATVAALLRNDSKKELEIAKVENGIATKGAPFEILRTMLLGAESNRGL